MLYAYIGATLLHILVCLILEIILLILSSKGSPTECDERIGVARIFRIKAFALLPFGLAILILGLGYLIYNEDGWDPEDEEGLAIKAAVKEVLEPSRESSRPDERERVSGGEGG